LLIAAAGFWALSPALSGGWIGDDFLYLTGNPLMQDPHRLWKAWFQPGSFVEYYPLEESLQWIEWKCFGQDTRGYHLVNILLHLASSLLVWRLFAKLGLRQAWIGGLLFAVHPSVVESVSLINEFKNTLSLPFFLLALCAWIDFEERRDVRDYLLALGWFLAAMLSKITMAPFPVFILVFAWWKRGRVGWRDVQASLPFFLISFFLGVMTIECGVWFLAGKEVMTHDQSLPWLSRLALGGTSLAFYFTRVLVPLRPLPLYPQWQVVPPSAWDFLPWPLFLAAAFYLGKRRAGWGRHALLGLAFFALLLLPFLGFNWASYMTATWVMDHFLYIPMIGLLALVVAALGQVENRVDPSLRPAGMALLAALVVALAVESHAYAGKFIDDTALAAYTVENDPGCWFARANYAVDLQKSGRTDEAIDQLRIAFRENPDLPGGHVTLGDAYYSKSNWNEARHEFELATKAQPEIAETHNNLGNALLQLGQVQDAAAQYAEAIRLKPAYADPHCGLGNALTAENDLPGAVREYREALKIDPDKAAALTDLGFALLQLGRDDEAVQQLGEAARLKPDDAEALVNLAIAQGQAGHTPGALATFQQALQRDPRNPAIYYNRANLLFQAGRLQEAMTDYRQALELKPDYAEAHNNLGAALLRSGRRAEAAAEFHAALKIDPTYADARNNLARCK
jgi:tetratricopeptide (TPR) repeat protein